MARLAPPHVDTFARAFLDTLRAGSDSGVLARLTPRIQGIAHLHDSVGAARAQFPPGTPDQVELISAESFVPFNDGVTRRGLVYEFRTGGRWTIANLVVLEEFGMLFVDGVRITPMPNSVEALNRFTLEGKTPAHIVMFLLAVGVATFSLVAAILVVRTPMRRRWLWAGVALLGAGKFGINWSTGHTFTKPWAVQLFGVAAYRPGMVGPWLLMVSFPAGALVALARRHRALSASPKGRGPESVAPAAELTVAPDEREC